jgi:hypothetical protein
MEPRDRMGKTHVGRLITLSFIVLLGPMPHIWVSDYVRVVVRADEIID